MHDLVICRGPQPLRIADLRMRSAECAVTICSFSDSEIALKTDGIV